MRLNCGVGEDSWESLGLQRDPTELNWWLKIPSACQMYNLSVKLSSKCQTCLFQCLFDISLDVWLSSVQFSHSVVSNSLRPHELQHARPPCPSPTPGVHSNSSPSSRWCHPVISSSVIPFSSCPQPLPASESFPVSQLSAWGGQRTGCLVGISNYLKQLCIPDSSSFHMVSTSGNITTICHLELSSFIFCLFYFHQQHPS